MPSKVRTTCPYCGVGCGVTAQMQNAKSLRGSANLIAVSGDVEHPANLGRLCVKGTNLGATMGQSTRLKSPQIDGADVTWPEAVEHVAKSIQATIRDHGPDSVAFYLSGQMLTEDYYVANKLMKGFIGGANVDTNSRLCMAAAVAAHKRAFGEDVVPCDYDDLRACDVLVLVGSNAAWAHPILFQQAKARQRAGELKIIVIDPRCTPTAEEADLHLPIVPGADLTLFNGLLAFLHSSGSTDPDYIDRHTRNFQASLAAATANAAGIEATAKACGLSTSLLVSFYELFAATEKVITMFSQGVNQSIQGVDQCNAIINCHLATGRIGRPGMGPFSITGQPNAMGGREVGGMANTLAAHLDFDSAAIDKVQRFWNAPAIATKPGLKAVDMFNAVATGQIKFIWIIATNPVASLPDTGFILKALERCPTVVVSDCYADTDTVTVADVKLPAQGWGEKDGTVTNSERCISRQRRLLAPAFAAKADWQIICEVAAAMGFGAAFSYQSAAQIFAEHAALSQFENEGERVFNLASLTQLSLGDYDEMKPQRWPMQRKPFADGRFSTADGRAQFMPTPPLHLPQANVAYPFLLNSGRLRDQWHTMSRTSLAETLNQHTPEPRLQINPADAQALGIAPDSLIEVSASTGQAFYLAQVDTAVKTGEVFAPIHWTRAHAGRSVVSTLVPRVVDPISGQPHSKQVSVALRRICDVVWLRGVLFKPVSSKLKQRLLGEVIEPQASYWCVLPGRGGLHFEIACRIDDARQINLELRGLFSQAAWQTLRMGTGVRRQLVTEQGVPKLVCCQADERNELPAFGQMTGEWYQENDTEFPVASTADWRRLAFSDVDLDTSPQICSCFEVSYMDITACISRGTNTVNGLGEMLRCGTNCGSCVPELNRLIATHADDVDTDPATFGAAEG